MCFSVQIDRDVNKVAHRLGAQISTLHFEHLAQSALIHPKKFKSVDEQGRIYPNYYSPVIVIENKKRLIKPMRYRVRPRRSKEEVPTKFNVFNARLDSLLTRQTWSPLIGKQHCLIPALSFFEWVTSDGKKKQIEFMPENQSTMWVAGLYDIWIAPDKSETIESFAIITTDPPEEISSKGHDRCPITLEDGQIDEWLDTTMETKKNCLELLTNSRQLRYGNKWVV